MHILDLGLLWVHYGTELSTAKQGIYIFYTLPDYGVRPHAENNQNTIGLK